LDTMRLQRIIEYTSLNRDRLRLAGMLHLMKKQPSGNLESNMDEDREEQEAPRDAIMIDSTPEEHIPKDQNETIDLEILVDPPREVTVTKKRQTWLRNTL